LGNRKYLENIKESQETVKNFVARGNNSLFINKQQVLQVLSDSDENVEYLCKTKIEILVILHLLGNYGNLVPKSQPQFS